MPAGADKDQEGWVSAPERQGEARADLGLQEDVRVF